MDGLRLVGNGFSIDARLLDDLVSRLRCIRSPSSVLPFPESIHYRRKLGTRAAWEFVNKMVLGQKMPILSNQNCVQERVGFDNAFCSK